MNEETKAKWKAAYDQLGNSALRWIEGVQNQTPEQRANLIKYCPINILIEGELDMNVIEGALQHLARMDKPTRDHYIDAMQPHEMKVVAEICGVQVHHLKEHFDKIAVKPSMTNTIDIARGKNHIDLRTGDPKRHKTVGDLKSFLEGISDETLIFVDHPEGGYDRVEKWWHGMLHVGTDKYGAGVGEASLLCDSLLDRSDLWDCEGVILQRK